MPIYEYVCTACEHEYEELARSMNAAQSPPCPACRSKAVRRRLSVFAARQAAPQPGGLPTGGGCMRCGDPEGPCAT